MFISLFIGRIAPLCSVGTFVECIDFKALI